MLVKPLVIVGMMVGAGAANAEASRKDPFQALIPPDYDEAKIQAFYQEVDDCKEPTCFDKVGKKYDAIVIPNPKAVRDLRKNLQARGEGKVTFILAYWRPPQRAVSLGAGKVLGAVKRPIYWFHLWSNGYRKRALEKVQSWYLMVGDAEQRNLLHYTNSVRAWLARIAFRPFLRSAVRVGAKLYDVATAGMRAGTKVVVSVLRSATRDGRPPLVTLEEMTPAD